MSNFTNVYVFQIAGSQMIIYGGRNENQVFNDLYILTGLNDIQEETMLWKRIGEWYFQNTPDNLE